MRRAASAAVAGRTVSVFTACFFFAPSCGLPGAFPALPWAEAPPRSHRRRAAGSGHAEFFSSLRPALSGEEVSARKNVPDLHLGMEKMRRTADGLRFDLGVARRAENGALRHLETPAKWHSFAIFDGRTGCGHS